MSPEPPTTSRPIDRVPGPPGDPPTVFGTTAPSTSKRHVLWPGSSTTVSSGYVPTRVHLFGVVHDHPVRVWARARCTRLPSRHVRRVGPRMDQCRGWVERSIVASLGRRRDVMASPRRERVLPHGGCRVRRRRGSGICSRSAGGSLSPSAPQSRRRSATPAVGRRAIGAAGVGRPGQPINAVVVVWVVVLN